MWKIIKEILKSNYQKQIPIAKIEQIEIANKNHPSDSFQANFSCNGKEVGFISIRNDRAKYSIDMSGIHHKALVNRSDIIINTSYESIDIDHSKVRTIVRLGRNDSRLHDFLDLMSLSE